MGFVSGAVDVGEDEISQRATLGSNDRLEDMFGSLCSLGMAM